MRGMEEKNNNQRVRETSDERRASEGGRTTTE